MAHRIQNRTRQGPIANRSAYSRLSVLQPSLRFLLSPSARRLFAALFELCEPEVDLLRVEAPVGPDLERGQFSGLYQAIDGARMYLQMVGELAHGHQRPNDTRGHI